MNEFDRIIGYSDVKRELARIADSLKNPEVYQALGAAPPRGLLLHGEPGVGKSLMAQCLLDASGRKAFVCRKVEPGGEFVRTIRETFTRAAEQAPSIVFLDDMDKFANDDHGHCDSEEYVTVQSCMDEVRAREVFTLATANDIDKLPDSLLRAGRFDRVIEVMTPEGQDAVEIIRHYLSSKKLTGDSDPETIADVLAGRSCAVLETVVNEAGLLAGYRRAEHITASDLMDAALRCEYEVDPGSHIPVDLGQDSRAARLVIHEAGHAAISELLSPGSVKLVIARCEGRTPVALTKAGSMGDCWHLDLMEEKIMVALAGRAATELYFGSFDTGTARDLKQAFETTRELLQDHCFTGYDLYSYYRWEDSAALTARQENAAAVEVARYDRMVRELLVKNRGFLDAVAQALAEKGVLTTADIRALRAKCGLMAG